VIRNTTAVMIAAIMAVAIGLTTVALADTEEPAVDVTVVFGATRSDAKSTDVAASVYTVDEAAIEASQATTVQELLHTIPGVRIMQQGSPGGAVTVFTRGGESNQTLVVVDGIRINNPMTGLVDLANMTVDQVRRVEYVKGPFTTLYGADAMSGVIYIFTKPGAQVDDQISVGGGNFGAMQASVALGDGQGDRGWALSGSYVDGDGSRDANSDYNGFSTAARFDAPVGGGVLTLTGRYQDYEHGIRGPLTGLSATDRQDLQTTLGSLSWQREGTSSRDTVRVGLWNEQYAFDYTDWFGAPQRAEADPTYLEAGWQHDFLADDTEINVGAEFKRFEGDYTDTSMGTYNEENESTAGYAQVQYRPGDWRLVGGVRVEDDNLFNPDTTWRVGATRLINDGEAGVWANYGTSFRAPTFNDMFFPGSGNTNLTPETSTGWELGLWDSMGAGDSLEVVYFRNDYEDLIQWAPAEGGLWQPFNVGTARTHGAEVTATHQLNSNWSNEISFSLLDTQSSAGPLLRRPRQQASCSFVYDGARSDLRLDAYYVGKRFDVVGFATEQVESYFVVDLGAEHQLSADTSAWLRVNNLFDQSYEAAAGYPSPGFALVGGITRDL